MGKEADITCRNASLAHPRYGERGVGKSDINAYANEPREMCET